MSQKRKISIRKILQAITTMLLASGCVVLVLSASKVQDEERLRDVFLKVENENKYQFINKEDLLKSIIRKHHLVSGKTALKAIHLKAIEQQVYEDPWAASVQVYIDNQRMLHINVKQYLPAARVFFENGESYYITNSLKLLPTIEQFTYYTHIVTNVPWFNNDSMNLVTRAQVLAMIRTIERDSFWSAQVEQISMTPDLEFELYPVLGTHKILFGDTTMATRKLENLFAFYKRVLNKIGWDKYELLDVRYKDQIIASPELAWKKPAKGFNSNMDWVKTILGDAPETSKESTGVTTTTLATPGSKPVAVPIIKKDTVQRSAPAPSRQPPKSNTTATQATPPKPQSKSTEKQTPKNTPPPNNNNKPKYILN